MYKITTPLLIKKGNKELYKYVTIERRVNEIVKDDEILANYVRTKLMIK